MSDGPIVAAFDFDGTITRRDTLVPFLFRVAGPVRTARVLSIEVVRSRGNRDALKEGVMAHLFGGRPIADLQAEGSTYAETLSSLFEPAIVDQIAWHQDAGHHVVIVSASLRLYLGPVAERLGIEHLICVDLETDDADRCTGRLVGANVRGREKEVRLRRWFTEVLGGEPAELWSYGDSSGDRELLRMADHPVPVTARARRLLEA